MSAFLVCKTHIDALLTAGLRLDPSHGPLRWWYPAIDPNRDISGQNPGRYELTRETAGQVGAMLMAENQRSVNHRYDEDDWEPPYLFSELHGSPDPVVVLKAIGCYEYQSCEHDGWQASEAFQFCEALRRRAIRKLPGYSEGPGWEISDPAVFQTARV